MRRAESLFEQLPSAYVETSEERRSLNQMAEENGKQLIMITWTKRLLLTCTILGLLAINVLTLTNTAFNAAVSGLMSATLGVQTVAEMMDNKLRSKDKAIKNQKSAAIHRRASAKKFGTRLVSRTKRVAAAGIARIPAESLPLVGVTVLLAGTAYELYEACEGLADLDQLYSEIGMPEQVPDDVMHSVCNPELPDFSTDLY